MAQSDARFGYRAKLKREAHDLSRPFGFTCAPGMLLPIFQDIATPGDTYYIKHDLTFLRTAPLAAPAMVDLNVHYETFFVPMQMIYQPFENTIFSLKNIQSSMYDMPQLMNNNFPLFDYSGFIDTVVDAAYQQSTEHAEAFRLADMLDLNGENFAWDKRSVSAVTPRYSFKPSFFPWQILAYHTIFNYFYRLDDKTQFNNDFGNFDQHYKSATPVYASVVDFMDIYQRPWKFDYFTSIYRSPIVSDVNMQQILPSDYYNYLKSNLTQKITQGGVYTTLNSSTNSFSSVVNSSSDINVQLSVGTASIRQIFANEKLAMITGRSKKTYDAQVLAHYGTEVPHDVKHDISLIGRDMYPVHVGEVTSLAATNDASLGDLSGKGWAQSPNEIMQHKFTAPCHGVIMTIFSVEPQQRYYGGFNRINSIVNAFDIPTPEFDRLGNMPMFRYEAGSKTGTMTDNDVIGWKERYYANKRRAPKTTCAFMNPYRGFTAVNSYESYMISNQPFDLGLPPFNNVGRPDYESAFYINRHAMDSLMLVQFQDGWLDGYVSGTYDANNENWNRTPWLAYARDPFIVDSFEKVTKVSWMSKDGEPIYDF